MVRSKAPHLGKLAFSRTPPSSPPDQLKSLVLANHSTPSNFSSLSCILLTLDEADFKRGGKISSLGHERQSTSTLP